MESGLTGFALGQVAHPEGDVYPKQQQRPFVIKETEIHQVRNHEVHGDEREAEDGHEAPVPQAEEGEEFQEQPSSEEESCEVGMVADPCRHGIGGGLRRHDKGVVEFVEPVLLKLEREIADFGQPSAPGAPEF